MPGNPLAVLKKGLLKLQEQVKERREKLTARLAKQEKISKEDEAWLDNEANVIDEERVIEDLERASDYERGLGKLDEKRKGVVQRLRELAAGKPSADTIGKKRKRPEPSTKPKTASSGKKALQPPVFTHKEIATVEQRIEILDWHNKNGKNQSKTAKHFDSIYPNLRLKQPTISAWVKDEDKWRERHAASGGASSKAKRARQTQHPEVSEMLELWILKAMGDNVAVTGEVLRQKWVQFADLVRVPEDERLSLSQGWLEKFKKRNSLREFKRHGEAASANPESIAAERARMRELLEKYGYPLRDLFNMDETGLFYGMPPDRGLADKKHSGVKGSKVRLTYAFTTNANGSEKRPAFIIGKAKKPRAFGNKTGLQLGFLYRNNAKAWMTTELYQDWLSDWDRELKLKNRHILLLQDNFAGHVPPEGLTNIKVENFAPNLTAHVQPADAGIIRCFKAHYRARYIQRAIDRYDSDTPPAQIYDINQLEAMRLAELAWQDVDATTISHCWQKTGILPIAQVPSSVPTVPIASLIEAGSENPIARAEKVVEERLDNLVRTGALQPNNRMDINSLLNPEAEKRMLDDSTEQEIFDAVMHAREAKENGVVNGGDDDKDDDAPVPERPSRRQALQGVDTVQRFIEGMEEPYARKLEVILASFGRATRLEESRTMKDTSITDFLQRE